MNHSDLSAARMASQHLVEPLAQPADVARWMGALQAQDYGQAVWGLGLRSANGTLAGVRRALADRQIVRTWPMRGTLHFTPAEDAGWMVALNAHRTLVAARRRLEELELDEYTVARSQEVMAEVLAGGQLLARPVLLSRLEDDFAISTRGQRGYHLLVHAALKGVICIGPMVGKQPGIALLDAWVPHPRRLSREEGLAELARRYFTSHGPATLRDFAWWGGMTLTDARAGLAEARRDLELTQVDGEEYWFRPAEIAAMERAGGLWLLAGFDELLLGYTDRSATLSAEDVQAVTPGSNGMFRAIVVSEGRVRGVWLREVKKDTLWMRVQPLRGFEIRMEELRIAARRYADFLGLAKLEIEIETL